MCNIKLSFERVTLPWKRICVLNRCTGIGLPYPIRQFVVIHHNAIGFLPGQSRPWRALNNAACCGILPAKKCNHNHSSTNAPGCDLSLPGGVRARVTLKQSYTCHTCQVCRMVNLLLLHRRQDCVPAIFGFKRVGTTATIGESSVHVVTDLSQAQALKPALRDRLRTIKAKGYCLWFL